MFRFLLPILFLVCSFAANAENSNWVSSESIKARIVAEDDGKFGVEISMPNGWHTYYKEPGEAGVPTEFDFSKSQNITVKEVTYPEYKKFDEYGIKTNGYDKATIFPVDAEIGENAVAAVKVSGAVCHEICIPYELNLSHKIKTNAGEKVDVSYLVAIWSAFLAGLILNVMPCVLPILSLKVLSVVKQAGKEVAHARMNFLVTALGILTSFLALAGFAVFVKSAGMAAGWGMQFQSPYFIGFLLVIVMLFALSLFGLFHINPPSWLVGNGAHKDSLVGNFISGALATLLGTACTAPVLVTAVGFALTRQTQDIFLIFAVMGVGMSLPYLLLAARPQLANCLPKPGAWMVKVKYFMGVLLLGTALWLGYVLYEQIAEPQEMAEISGGQEWQVFDESKIPTFIAEGKTVFVDVTAAWCVNCKANKLAVLDTEEITKFFADNNVVLLKGDMTRPSKPLLEYIKKYNRFGIPFNMVYGPNAKDGILLDSLLSKDAVKAAIEKAK